MLAYAASQLTAEQVMRWGPLSAIQPDIPVIAEQPGLHLSYTLTLVSQVYLCFYIGNCVVVQHGQVILLQVE